MLSYIKYINIFTALLLVLTMGASCKNDPKKQKTASALKVAFITVGPVTDGGYNQSHNVSKKFIESKFKDRIATTLVEKVPETADVERVMQRLVSQGHRLIFATSYGYFDSVRKVAKKHPDIVFMHAGGAEKDRNVGTYFAYLDEPYYLAGIAAGHATSGGKLGFVAAHPIPNVLREINAFALGARSVRPDATVNVVWTNSWSDPAKEVDAANSLVDAGADVLAVHQDSPVAVLQTAEKRGIFSVGCHFNGIQYAPKGWLTGAEWVWGEVIDDVVQDVLDGKWKSAIIRGGLKDGYVALSPFGPSVKPEVRAEVEAAKAKLMSGERQVFRGEIKDRDGSVRVPAAKVADFKTLETMDWVVEGVVGVIPR